MNGTLTINTVDDLLFIINTRPEWRQRLRKSLFPEIDLPKAFQELAKAQQRTEASIQRLTIRMDQLTAHVGEIKRTQDEMKRTQDQMKRSQDEMKRSQDEMKRTQDEMKRSQDQMKRSQDQMKRTQDEMKHTQNDLKGWTYEHRIRDRAAGIFGRFLRRGKNKRAEIGDWLEEAEDNGQISESEHDQVLASDLLWGGKLKATKEESFLVVEVSFTAELTDIERAVTRAAILRSIGLKALPVVSGIIWPSDMVAKAHREGVVCVKDMALDKVSWREALLKIGA